MTQESRPALRDWLSAFRLRTLPLASACILTGASLSFSGHPQPGLVLLFALLTAFLLQVLSNLANDYGDSIHGADNDARVGPSRMVQSGRIGPAAMKRAVAITALLALVSGLLLLWFALGSRGEWTSLAVLLAAGLFAIAAAYRYTAGSNPYGYRGFGDLAVFLFFGLLGVMGSAYLFRAGWSADDLLPALWIGFQSMAVLNLNNLRDHENDRQSGKHTLIVRIGYGAGRVVPCRAACRCRAGHGDICLARGPSAAMGALCDLDGGRFRSFQKGAESRTTCGARP
jgi:1,4-dihydroxy-2-naphthoate polyprenyltransferase